MQTCKYLLASEHDALWGLTVTTIGYEEIAPGESYPTKGHADGYYFNTSRGRVLQEYQLLYITEGEGTFSSANQAETRLRKGDMFLLFPGEWHSYHPLSRQGWKSYWIGFRGTNMDQRVAAGFFSPAKPIYHVGFPVDVINLYQQAFDTAQQEAANCQQLLAGLVNHLLGLMCALERNNELGRNQQHVAMVQRACQRIRETLESPITIQQIAEEMGFSYSYFRTKFKNYTGLSPAVYQQDLRLQRAKELITTTEMSIKEIAYRLNFDTPDYFSARFKQKTGQRPTELRDQ